MTKHDPSPAYLMYPSDILSSGRVAALKPLEELWYRRALDLGWEHNGMPSDPAEFAGWVGRGCTAKAAEKIIERFYEPAKKDPSRVVNPRQEKERKLFLQKRKQKSEAGKRGMANRWKQKDKSDNSVITENNISISIPISKDLKRLIDNARARHPQIDDRIVELGVLQTMLRRNGSNEPIKSMKYFDPEIKSIAAESKNVKPAVLDAMVARRREQYSKMTEGENGN